MYYTCYKTHLYAMMKNVHKAIRGISRLGPLSTLHDSELSYKTDHNTVNARRQELYPQM